MIRVVYFSIITLHILYALLVLSVIPLIVIGKLDNPNHRVAIALVIVVAAVLNLLHQQKCPLTILQQKIEIKIKPLKKPIRSFIEDNLAKIKIKVPRNFGRQATIFFIIADLFLLLVV